MGQDVGQGLWGGGNWRMLVVLPFALGCWCLGRLFLWRFLVTWWFLLIG